MNSIPEIAVPELGAKSLRFMPVIGDNMTPTLRPQLDLCSALRCTATLARASMYSKSLACPASADGQHGEAIKAWLNSEGYEQVFLDKPED